VKVLKIFVDGFGLGKNDLEINPIIAARTPCFDALLGGHKLWGNQLIKTSKAVLVPLDPLLGVPGVPQSATGQTTLWTGVNAAQAAGRHVNAYPTPLLREVIEDYSIFKTLTEDGYSVTFANAFRPSFFEALAEGQRDFSASTLVTLAAGLQARNLDDLYAGRAVYQDITNDILIEPGFDAPPYTPAQAGRHLAELVGEHDFTLFEFFQSDVAGHKQDMPRCVGLVERIDEFLGSVLENLSLADTLILLTSDHGNLEDLSVSGHTQNPVPGLIIGDYERVPYLGLRGIEDVASFILDVVAM